MAKIAEEGEPRRIDGQSAEFEYAIEHPLIGNQSQAPDNARAMALFFEAVRRWQDESEWKGSPLYQEALKADPFLHAHVREALLNLAKSPGPEEAGAIYYWLGIHSQYLEDDAQAMSWYAKAVEYFHKIGYPKREGRAHCNLGRLKMKHEDATGMEGFRKGNRAKPQGWDRSHKQRAGILFYQ